MDKSFEWIMLAINGSTSQFHFDGCEVLVALFDKKYGDEGSVYLNLLISALLGKRIYFSVDA